MDINFSDPDDSSIFLRINNIFEFIVSGQEEQWVPFELESENTLTLT